MNKFAIGWLLLLVSLVAFAGNRLANGQITIVSDLLSLVGQQQPFDQKIKHIAQQQQKKLIIVVAASQQKIAQQVAQQLTLELPNLASIDQVSQLPFNQQQVEQIIGLYGNYPVTLLSDDDATALSQGNGALLTEHFLTTMLQPGDPFVNLSQAHDPTMMLANALQQKLASQSQWFNDGSGLYQQLDGVFYYPLFIELAQAGVGVNQAVTIEANINQYLQRAADAIVTVSEPEQADRSVRFYRSGLLFHISASTVQASNEIQLFGLLSSLLILAVTFLVFRSLLPLILVMLLIGVCITVGTAGLFSVVTEVHLLTFIFAVSLIGISVDYGFHVLAAACLATPKNQSLSRYLAPAMLMGAVTTIIGYCGMLMMPMAALHQITVFMIFGLAAALFTALFWLAPLFSLPANTSPLNTVPLNDQSRQSPSSPQRPRKRLQLSPWVKGLIGRLTKGSVIYRNRRHLALLVAALLLVLLSKGGRLQFDDNVRNLNGTAQTLLAQERKVQQLMGYSSYPRYIVINAKTEAAVLTIMDQVTGRLNQTLATGQAQGQLAAKTQSLSLWIPPLATQQANKMQFKQLIEQGALATLQSYIEPSQWQQLIDGLDTQLNPADWPPALSLLAMPLWHADDRLNSQPNNQVYGIIGYFADLTVAQQQFVSGQVSGQVNDPSQAIYFFDQPKRISQSLAAVRSLLSGFFLLACGAFALMLVIRYGVKQGLLALCTPVFAALGSLLISQLFIPGLSIFNLLACLLIVALAVDYIVFFVEQGHKEHVVLAVLLSAFSSMTAFGMMTFSQTPAVYHFGLTTFIGILLALLLAFITPLSYRLTKTTLQTQMKGKPLTAGESA